MNQGRVPYRLLWTVCLVAALALPGFAQAPSLAPPNSAFLDYVRGSSLQSYRGDVYPSGLIPEPVDLSATNGLAVASVFADTALPASYDIRPLGKLTPVRNQGSCGSCWDFASIGSLESSLMPAEPWDFSENNLKNLAGFDISCCSGGNRTMSTAYLTRWAGPVSETDDPYNTGSCSSPAVGAARKHVQEVIYLPNRTGSLDNDALKQAVMGFGAVYTTYYHNNSYFKSSTAGYYYNGTGSANHAVCIVGWDDNYSKSNFLIAPPGNGAFLIRNSWGSYWGLSGYFWISYYDTFLGKNENAVFRAESNNYDGIYQYDTLGWTSAIGYGTASAWFANVFTATANTKVVATSWYTPSPNSSYEVYVYLNPSSGPIGTSAAYKAGTMPYAGYHTITLDSPVPVTAGQKFSVVVKTTNNGYGYPIPLEQPWGGYSSRATASLGQSYMSSNGSSWTDVAGYYANTNVCLKAFTAASSAPAPGVMSVTPATSLTASGNAGGPFSPSSQSYTLTNTGGGSVSWTAARSQSWTSLSATSGTLAAGATATVTVSVNSAANSLAAGIYSDTVSFVNTTNGVGNTVRTVSLTANAQQQGALSVTPSNGLAASGSVGGPFSPSSQSYTLTNTGSAAMNWMAGKAQPWTTLSPTSGFLSAGSSVTVTVSVNASNAAGLAAGQYADTLTIANTTNGVGSTTRSLSLTVTSVTPPPPSNGYRVVPTTFNWIDPANHTRLPLADDSVSAAQYLPFGFTFYGKAYDRLYVGANGLMGFGVSGIFSYLNTNLPMTYTPNATIYPYWDNLNPGTGGSVFIGTVGSAPNRKVVVSWVDVPSRYSTYTRFTLQAVVEESSGDVVFQYLNVSPNNYYYGAGKSATIGIENETGKQAVLYSYNKANAVANNTALRFTTLPGTVGRGF